MIIDSDFIPYLVRLLGHPSERVVMGALRAVGNIVTGNDEQTQEVLNRDVFRHLRTLLSQSDTKKNNVSKIS